MRIIINADDLGISREVNQAILDLISTGRVTSATLLANGPAIVDAVRWVGKWRRCSFGAHLNLTEFTPLTRDAWCLLTAPTGEMSRRRIEQAWPTPRMLQAVFDELSLQIQTLFALGVPVSHIDSHQHAHTIPQIFPALKAAQRRFGIRRLRASRNIYRSDEAVSPVLLIKKKLFNRALRTVYASRTPDGFTDVPTLLQMGQALSRDFESIEVAAHPGARGQEEETAILQSEWIESLPFTAELSSYLQL